MIPLLENQQNVNFAQRRLRSVWASTQSVQSLRCALSGKPNNQADLSLFAGRTRRFDGFVMLPLIYILRLSDATY